MILTDFLEKWSVKDSSLGILAIAKDYLNELSIPSLILPLSPWLFSWIGLST